MLSLAFVVAMITAGEAFREVARRDKQRAAYGQNSSHVLPDVGIWYSTWYTNKGKYLWAEGHGKGSSKQFLADVNGDGRDDAVVFFEEHGSWFAALSTGGNFAAYSRWIRGHGAGSDAQFLKDVNGDGKADAVILCCEGSWYVALSTGTSFSSYSLWLSGSGSGARNLFMEDVNNDGQADAIYYFSELGGQRACWYVALSTGTRFGAEQLWTCGHGAGSDQQMVADIDGDGRADAVVRFGSARYVARSEGTRFGSYSLWGSGEDCDLDSTRSMLGDFNGDGKADSIVFQGDRGNWCVSLSTGVGFERGVIRMREHVYSHSKWKLPPVTETFLGRLGGSHDVAAVVYSQSTGEWRALPSSFETPIHLNLWEFWGIKYRPWVAARNAFEQYDTSDPAVIHEHAHAMDTAGVDFLLYDMTNHVGTGFIRRGAEAVSAAIAGDTSLKLRYAVAGGGIQFTGSPETLENEARQVWEWFVTHPVLGRSYYNVSGKPFFVSYASWSNRQAWERHPDHAWTDRFHLRWVSGSLPERSGEPPSEYRGQYVGWGLTQGTLPSSENMVVMPGWDNHLGAMVNRDSGTYYDRCWEEVHVQAARPEGLERVIINSYNEYAEQTAVGPADTSSAPYQWPEPNHYWARTLHHLQLLGKAR